MPREPFCKSKWTKNCSKKDVENWSGDGMKGEPMTIGMRMRKIESVAKPQMNDWSE